jgi:hypothetical protein
MHAVFTPLLLAAMLAMTGCSIKQTVTPASLSPDLPSEICLIPAEGLRTGFNTTYTALLKDKGFQTRELTPGSSPSTCALSTTYIGTWSWDLALYMSYADIRVFKNGRQVGQAEYDSRWGGGRLDKFIDAETKITELTNQLFPHGSKLVADIAISPAPAAAPLSKEAYRQKQLQLLMQQGSSYEDYQKRYREIMAD